MQVCGRSYNKCVPAPVSFFSLNTAIHWNDDSVIYIRIISMVSTKAFSALNSSWAV